MVAKCDDGYFYTIAGFGKTLSGYEVIGGPANIFRQIKTTFECATRCNSNPDCMGYAYSSRQGKCFLSKVTNPEKYDRYEDYIYCSKQQGNVRPKTYGCRNFFSVTGSLSL